MEQYKVFRQLLTYTIEEGGRVTTVMKITSSVPAELIVTVDTQANETLEVETSEANAQTMTHMLDMMCKSYTIVPYHHIFDGRDNNCTIEHEDLGDQREYRVKLSAGGGTSPFLILKRPRAEPCTDCVLLPEIRVRQPTARHDFFYHLNDKQRAHVGAVVQPWCDLSYRYLEEE